MKGDFMRKEYDFSVAERGKFYRPDNEINLPVYLDKNIQEQLQALASARGVELNALVNELLKKDLELIQLGT